MKVLTVVGTRLEAIKLAPVLHELRRRGKERPLRSLLYATGQHRQLLDQVLWVYASRRRTTWT